MWMKKYNPKDYPVIAIDLDGTIIEEGYYPDWGEPFPHAIPTINQMVKEGYDVVIWTSRDDKTSKLAIKELEEIYGLCRNLPVNQHAKHFTDKYPVNSPKIAGSIYLDDRSLGAPDFKIAWPKIRQAFCKN